MTTTTNKSNSKQANSMRLDLQSGAPTQSVPTDELDNLFHSLRASEPSLSDENFTKMVLNSVDTSAHRERRVSRASRSGISFDLVGLLVGVVCVYMFVEMRSVIEFVLSFVPQSLILTPAAAAVAVVGLGMLSIAAWWVVEEGSRA